MPSTRRAWAKVIQSYISCVCARQEIEMRCARNEMQHII